MVDKITEYKGTILIISDYVNIRIVTMVDNGSPIVNDNGYYHMS